MNIIDPTAKKNWKFIAVVVVLGLAVSGGVVWYANLPTPAPQPVETSAIQNLQRQQLVDTSGWRTYRSEGPSLLGATDPQGEFGFEVRYP